MKDESDEDIARKRRRLIAAQESSIQVISHVTTHCHWGTDTKDNCPYFLDDLDLSIGAGFRGHPGQPFTNASTSTLGI